MTKHDYIDNCWTLKHLSNKNNNFSFSPHAHFNSTTCRSAASAADNYFAVATCVVSQLSEKYHHVYSGYLIVNTISPNCEVLAVSVELSRQTSNISIISSNILLIFAIFLLILNVKHTKYYFKKIICLYVNIWIKDYDAEHQEQ